MTAEVAQASKDDSERESWGSFTLFVTKLALAVFIFRSFFFSFYTIPSESMLPRLWNGDYFVAAKWPYGYSRWSLPFNLPLIPGHVLASLPERGDVVVFKHPVDKVDYIKRVVGLPGDSIAMRGGQLIINGTPVKRERIGDFLIPQTPNTACAWGGADRRVRLQLCALPRDPPLWRHLRHARFRSNAAGRFRTADHTRRSRLCAG